MEEEAPNVVVDDLVTVVEDEDVFTADDAPSRSPSPPPLSMLNKRRSSVRWMVETPEGEEGGNDTAPSASFAKLVRTVQFIKKWARRAEREPDSAREEFLDRFKMNGPSADSVFGATGSCDDVDLYGRDEWRIIKYLKKRRHLILIWNPSGQWLYRCVIHIGVGIMYM